MRGTDSTWVGSAAVSMTRLMTGRVAATCAWGTSNTSSSCTCVCVQHHCAGEMDGRLMAAGQERKACCHLRQLAGRASVKLPKTELLQLLMAVVGSSSRRVLGIFNVRRCAAGGGRKRVQAYCMWVTRARVLHVLDLRSCASWQCMRGGNGSAARCPQPEARAILHRCQLLTCGPKKLINRVNPLEARAIPQRYAWARASAGGDSARRHLQQHAGVQTLGAERRLHADHGPLDDVRCSSLWRTSLCLCL